MTGDSGGFFANAALLSFEQPTTEVRRYIEQATGYVIAQAHAEENPTRYRLAVRDGHAALYRDAYLATHRPAESE